MTNLLYILLALVMLGIVIIIHEFGHFIVGRLCGIGVVEFSIGMGPKLIGWHHKETDYSIRLLPLGGYCKFLGEDEDNPAPNAMNAQSVWKRILTVFAGPAMNFVLAFVAAVIILMGYSVLTDLTPLIDSVVEDMPAAAADLQSGDIVTAVNGTEITYDTEGVEALRAAIQANDSVELTIQRGDETLTVTLVPEVVETDDDSGTTKQIGISFTGIYTRLSFFDAVRSAGYSMVNTVQQMLAYLRNLVFKGEGLDDLAGPVGTVAVVSQSLQEDSSLFLDYLYVISLNLGIINLLPLPALDGGRLVFLFIEAIRGKPVPPEKEGMVHAIGLLAFLVLAVVLVFHDTFTYIL